MELRKESSRIARPSFPGSPASAEGRRLLKRDSARSSACTRSRGQRCQPEGKHTTTTTAELIALDFGGWVVDTPGIRQFALWDMMVPEEAEGFFLEFRPYVSLCGFPDCKHTHEERCAIKNAVALRCTQASSVHFSYLGMFEGNVDDGGAE